MQQILGVAGASADPGEGGGGGREKQRVGGWVSGRGVPQGDSNIHSLYSLLKDWERERGFAHICLGSDTQKHLLVCKLYYNVAAQKSSFQRLHENRCHKTGAKRFTHFCAPSPHPHPLSCYLHTSGATHHSSCPSTGGDAAAT